MWLVVIGVVLLLLKYFAVGFMVDISWFWCLTPFVLAFVYWEFIDKALHITEKRQMQKQVRKERDTRRRHADEMLSTKGSEKNRSHARK